MTPTERYQQDLARPDFKADPVQAEAVAKLQRLYDQLLDDDIKPSFLQKLLGAKPKVLGLYFWGGVGRGKTYLMDSFFESLPGTNKLRLHFHRFMHGVHHELKSLSGKPEPLQEIAKQLAKRTRVICFDEFYVSDITDAMILGELFKALFARNVILVATSNIPPQRLYWNGLQRDRFLPVIALLEERCEIFELDGGVDYRLRSLRKAKIYHSPLGPEAYQHLEYAFNKLAHSSGQAHCKLKVEGRLIQVERLSDNVVWFEFAEICGGPRSQRDYIEISRGYHSVLIGKVPQLTDAENDSARRFIALVDEFYERHVKLIISAAVPMAELYVGKGLAFEFERTLSRLEEMQSQAYLGLEHLA